MILNPIFYPSPYSEWVNPPLNFWDSHVGPTNPMANLQKGWLGDGLENEVEHPSIFFHACSKRIFAYMLQDFEDITVENDTGPIFLSFLCC